MSTFCAFLYKFSDFVWFRIFNSNFASSKSKNNKSFFAFVIFWLDYLEFLFRKQYIGKHWKSSNKYEISWMLSVCALRKFISKLMPVPLSTVWQIPNISTAASLFVISVLCWTVNWTQNYNSIVLECKEILMFCYFLYLICKSNSLDLAFSFISPNSLNSLTKTG